MAMQSKITVFVLGWLVVGTTLLAIHFYSTGDLVICDELNSITSWVNSFEGETQ